jgi:DNA (cytosine-5)-methyltransferase 1
MIGDRRDACPTFIDLFCGIGGFRLAFERAGCQCVFSSDWNKYAQITYAANFGETPHGDIHSVAVAIPAHDILCAGFPCQPFSIAGVSKKLSLGKAHGFDDKEQGNLFFSLAEIIKFHQPAAFVLENVKNLKRHDQGRTFQIIYTTLTDALGYHLHTAIIDAQSVVPQHRERIFLVGFKERRAFEFPEFPAQGPKLESILETDVPDKYNAHQSTLKNFFAMVTKKLRVGLGKFIGQTNRLVLEWNEILFERRLWKETFQPLAQNNAQLLVERDEPVIECRVVKS